MALGMGISMRSRPWQWQVWPSLLVFATRFGLGAIFLSSGFAKILQPYDFLGSVYSYSLTGPTLGYLVAFVLPWFEFFLGIALLTGTLHLGALLASGVLLALFTCIKASAVHRDLKIGCGCHITSAGEVVGVMDVAVTGAMLLITVCAFVAAIRARHRVLQVLE